MKPRIVRGVLQGTIVLAPEPVPVQDRAGLADTIRECVSAGALHQVLGRRVLGLLAQLEQAERKLNVEQAVRGKLIAAFDVMHASSLLDLKAGADLDKWIATARILPDELKVIDAVVGETRRQIAEAVRGYQEPCPNCMANLERIYGELADEISPPPAPEAQPVVP